MRSGTPRVGRHSRHNAPGPPERDDCSKSETMTDMIQRPNRTAPAGLVRYLPAAVILAVALAGAFLLRDVLDFETLRRNRTALLAYRDAHLTLAALGFVAAYVVIVGFSLPGATIATLTGGFLFGTLAGAALSVVGATIGACVIFLAARFGPGERLRERIDASSGALRRVKRGLDANQWSMLFFIRFVPVVPFFVANLVPAFLGVPLHRFTISTFFGIMPGAVVYSSVGAGLGSVFERGETPELHIVFEPQVLLPLLALAALSLLPVAVRALRSRKETAE